MRDKLTDLDREIDDVAREITAGHVDDGFVRRVAARVEQAGAQPARIWRRSWLLAPAAACVVLLTAFVVRDVNVRLTTSGKATADKKSDATTVPPAIGVRVTTSGRDAAVKQPDATAVPPAIDVRAATSARATAVRKPDATGGSAAAASDPDLRPLTMAPIEMASIDVAPLVGVIPIEIAAIGIDRIEISAMP